ncbi:hypothetical protein BN1051_00028 [Arthrobacter saudimassiliensis]|uniref:Translational regulator CsrA n=1 Tax=Arthrobacter saudimassiliensis TaxID=1461584 RepID=A0A078MGY8_9MICC|nr:hypothetical protein BN1051_00028 [Arthrobacter saudimassiliensis]
MLVLTRKSGEQVMIGDDIVVTILETRGDGIRIGIDAPRGVKIQRSEVVRAVEEANVAAAEAGPDAEERMKAFLAAARPVTRRPDAE